MPISGGPVVGAIGSYGGTGAQGAQGSQGAQGGGGGGGGGNAVVRKFPFAFDTPGILTGAALYTPTVGDVLLDAWVEIDTAWNGTTPTGDVGNFVGVDFGLFHAIHGGWSVDMTGADGDFSGTGMLQGSSVYDLAQLDGAIVGAGGGITTPGFGSRFVPLKFTAANPIKVVVSQNGLNTGDDPGSTEGAAILYLVTATPV